MSGEDSTLSHIKVEKKINSTLSNANKFPSTTSWLGGNCFASSGQILSEPTRNSHLIKSIETEFLIINNEVLFS